MLEIHEQIRPTMRLLIDLQACQTSSRFGGIGRYSMSLAKAMLRLESNHEILLLLNGRLPNENAIRAEFASLMPQQHIFTFGLPPYIAAAHDLPNNTRLAELIREKVIAEISPDILHVASLFEGAGEDVVTSVGLLFPAARTAVTLYDLIPYLEPEIYLASRLKSEHYMGKFAALQHAGMVVSISEFSRVEGLENTTISADRILNISSAVDGQFTPIEIPPQTKKALLDRCSINKPFLLFTGSFDVRKNHERLVQAFARLPPAIRSQHQLVIIGKGEERQIVTLKDCAKTAGLGTDDVVFVGHVSDVELVLFYNLCALFVFPSLREGFGLPVLEAMSCGAPTIGSNRTSMPEVIDRADALFDPEDIDDITAKMHAVLSDAGRSAELKRHGLTRAKNFSWALSAERALAFFERNVACMREPENVTDVSDIAAIYPRFRDALMKLDRSALEKEFVSAAARAIALNERVPGADYASDLRHLRFAWVVCATDRNVATRDAVAFLSDLPGESTVFTSFATETTEDAFDVVVFEYDRGALPLATLTELIHQQKKLQRYVFVLLQSCADFRAPGADNDALAVRVALKACDGIFVRDLADVKILEAVKVSKNVGFLPRLPSPETPTGAAIDGATKQIADYLRQKVASAIALAIALGDALV